MLNAPLSKSHVKHLQAAAMKSLRFMSARAAVAVPHSDTTVQTATPSAPEHATPDAYHRSSRSSSREEFRVLVVGSVREQDELCRAANIQKQQPSFNADVYVNGKREPVMQRDEHLSPFKDVVKPVKIQLHLEDTATSVQRSASLRYIHCIVCVALWTGDIGSIKPRIDKMRNAIVESWLLSDKSDEARAEDFPVLVVVLNPGPLSLEDFSRRVHEQLPSATVFSAFEFNKSESPSFAQKFAHRVAFMADKFNLKMKNRPAHVPVSVFDVAPMFGSSHKEERQKKKKSSCSIL